MGTYPPTQPDPSTGRIENLEVSLQQIIKIFAAPSEGLNIRGLYMTKEKALKIIFEKKQ